MNAPVYRPERQQMAAEAAAVFAQSPYAFFVSYKGLTVARFALLRAKLAKASATLQVMKNSYAILGMRATGAKVPADFALAGDTAVVCGGDPVAVMKLLRDLRREFEQVTVKAGVLEGVVLDARAAESVAEMPAKEVLYAEIVGAIAMPATALVRALESSLSSVVRVLQSHVAQQESQQA